MNKELNYDQLFNKELSILLASKRKEYRLTYTNVANNLGLNTITYMHYENNERTIPLGVMKDACRLYDLNYYDTFKIIDNTISDKPFKFVINKNEFNRKFK